MGLTCGGIEAAEGGVPVWLQIDPALNLDLRETYSRVRCLRHLIQGEAMPLADSLSPVMWV